MAKDKVVKFKFVDGMREIKVGDQVYEVDDRSSNPGTWLTVDKIGNKLITVVMVDGRSRYGSGQYYIADGRYKSECSSRRNLYSSLEAMEQHTFECTAIEKCRAKFGGYGRMPELTYDKACRIIKILEET